MATSKTPKELAETAMTAALDSLRAAIDEEARLQTDAIKAHREYRAAHCTEEDVKTAEQKLAAAAKRSTAAFKAWREACEAVPK